METQWMKIADLEPFQIRVETEEEKIQQYADYLIEHEGWGSFPPIQVVHIGGKFKIADGIHRWNAAKRANFETVPCEVTNGDAWILLNKSVEVNGIQGIGMGPKDWRNFRRIVLECLSRGDIPPKSYSDIGSLCQCSSQTIINLRNEMEEEGWVFPETYIGSDGKEYPFKRKSVVKNLTTENLATPAIPHEYCAAGCGTPIWDDIKEAKDCAYVQWDGKWFCSEECAQAYLTKQPEPQEPPDEDDDEYEDEEPVYVTCQKCGKRELEKNLHRAGWIHEKEEGHYGKDLWYCSKECRDWMKALSDESWKTEEPPAREPAPSSSQASGAEPDQEDEPEEFAFNDVDAETLPVYTAEPVESTSCGRWIRCYVEVEGTTDPEEALRLIKAEFPLTHGKLTLKFDGLNDNINIQNLNNNININHETFTEFFVNCRGKKGPVKVFISRKKYDEWKKNFGPAFDIDANLDECCKYYNELTGSEMLSAGGVYSKVYAWLLKNWKAQKKEESKPKKNAYKDAGLRFDPSIY